MHATDAPFRFHAYEVSYFSAKVRPALRYKGLWVDERRADLREIHRRTGLGFIPVVITPEGETWQDSTDIFDRLEARFPDPPLFPSTPVQRMAAHLVELYIDEFGVMPAMHTRWGSEEAETSTRARFSAMMGSTERGNAAADRMVAARAALGSTPETGPAIEQHLRDHLDALSNHFREHAYLLGGRMSFADCALMGQVDGHFFSDRVSRELLLETANPVVTFIERTRYPNEDQQAAWLEGDSLAPSFVEVLRVMGQDAAPVILDALEVVEDWADSRPDPLDEIPRSVGRVQTSLRGTPVERAAMPYVLLSVQRVLDAFLGFDEAGRNAILQALEGTGWEPVLAARPRHRLKRDGFALAFED